MYPNKITVKGRSYRLVSVESTSATYARVVGGRVVFRSVTSGSLRREA